MVNRPSPSLALSPSPERGTTLYAVVGGEDWLTNQIGLLERLGIRQWIYLGDDDVGRIHTGRAIGGRASRVSLAGLMDETSWELRQPYIDWIGELSGANASVEWWASGLAEKNPYGKLFVRICLLASAKKLIDAGLDGPTLVVCSSDALMEELGRLAGVAGIAVEPVSDAGGAPTIDRLSTQARRLARGPYRLARRAMGRSPAPVDADPAYRRDILAHNRGGPSGDFSGTDSILVFTWVDRRNFAPDGSYVDPHLGCLPEMLKERGFRIAYVPRVLPTIPFEEAVERLTRTGELLFFPELFTSLEEIEACGSRAERYRPVIPSDSRVGGVMVADLAKEEMDGDEHALAEALAYEPLTANLARAGVRPRQIMHTTEGHRWEYVVAYAARRHMPGTKVVAYEAGTYSRTQLSLYHAAGEHRLRPLPDRVVTNSGSARDTLAAGGLPPDIVKAGCAMRFREMSTAAPHSVGPDRPAPEDRGVPMRVLAATSITLGDSVHLAAKAVEAFGGDPGVELLVKPHPMVDSAELKRLLGDSAAHDNVRFVDEPIDQLLASVHVALYTYTNVCYEALWRGVPPVFVRAENALNLDKLEAAPDARWTATTPEDLRRAVSEIRSMTPDQIREWQSVAASALAAAMEPVTPECLDAFIA